MNCSKIADGKEGVMEDRDYTVLCQIERSMLNELSSSGLPRARFYDYVRGFTPKTIRPSSALKTLQMAQVFEERSPQKNPANIQACRIWQRRLSQACEGSMEKVLFARFPWNEPLCPEFRDEDFPDSPGAVRRQKRRGTAGLVYTLLCIAFLALLVLLWQINFYVCAIFVFILLNIGLWLILCVGRLRHEYRQLSLSRSRATGDVREYLDKFTLRRVKYSPRTLKRLARLQMRQFFGINKK